MAHADYHCCAICDCKLKYAGFNKATTKKQLCKKCKKKLKEHGINNIKEFTKFIYNIDYYESINLLKEIDFKFCYYDNDVDKEILSSLLYFHKGQTINQVLEKLKSLEEENNE